MTAGAGSNTRIQYSADGITWEDVAGARTESLTINAEPIDISSKDDGAVMRLLDDIGQESATVSIKGILVGTQIIDLIQARGPGSSLHHFRFNVDGFGTFSSKWFIEPFELGADYGPNSRTFSMTAKSGEAVVWTAV